MWVPLQAQQVGHRAACVGSRHLRRDVVVGFAMHTIAVIVAVPRIATMLSKLVPMPTGSRTDRKRHMHTSFAHR